MFRLRKKSDWKWNTSGGGAASAFFVTAGGGHFVLDNPKGGSVTFQYASAGATIGVGKSFLSTSHEDDFSTGEIHLLDSFHGGELSPQDFEGFSLIDEGSIGARGGASVTAMLLGIPWSKVPSEILKDKGMAGLLLQGAQYQAEENKSLIEAVAGPIGGMIFRKGFDTLTDLLRSNAKACLLIFGLNETLGISAGIAGSVGYVWSGKKPKEAPKPTHKGPALANPSEVVGIRTSSISRDGWDVIKIPGDALFDFDKSNIKPQADAALQEVARHIKAKGPSRIMVEGHTDGIGSDAHNLFLSNQRAGAVAQWILVRNLMKVGSVETKGVGKANPVAPEKVGNNDNPAGRAQNRRVEIFLYK